MRQDPLAATNAPMFRSLARIAAIGTYVPERKLTNADLERLVDTSDEWILQRTGIRERRIARDDQYTSHLAYAAVADLVARYDVRLDDVDYVIVATSTPDTVFPSVAAGVQARFGIKSCGAVDIQAACAGFTAGLQLANGLILSGLHRKILVIGADALSKITDYTDRTTCILFGDGAGAVLVERTEEGDGHFIASYNSTDGDGGRHVYCSHLAPAIGEYGLIMNGKLVQNGREVYRWAVSKVAEGVAELLRSANVGPEEIDWFVPHNANMRIIEALCERTGFRGDQAIASIAKHGNTSAASIPLAMDEALKDGRLKAGHTLLLHGFGGGLTQAGTILRWSL
ncbi:ketoacyl-ACP synthase III [Paenibacillus sp. LHD-117]|uniref:ketoacyl-ACP synthase III n=1 Tax=Paenibacillus sp. LHD-117 TaxID=3071412 RepID=UPI0027E0B0ED|nr:ketoacyl-ACP synthase III [Paenibacillus sp. LHD-117]MDQ6418330.1 ketoacyl-ACP synthase III [Paenibacillus sp. LHD-117]